MELLNKIISHWSSRQQKQLERDDQSIAYHLYQSGGHMLFNKPVNNITEYTSIGARHSRPSFDSKLPTFSRGRLHRILGHAMVFCRIN
ncbi:hypothetical protein OnM2_086006 [Erysiphe neolycopersici]|uniref:Uncharacterized protein n=1 Tax=Erysiphe neolycopersici TaxID=212602 RepID=A0A420HEG4_9PEZI|nr:hypothetical protein OnM2_086006 [Erysiphe neolycopersici]